MELSQFQNAKVEVDTLSKVEINLVVLGKFDQADLGDGKPTKINRVER
ncbi:MAG: hypothetical protein V7K48_06145 [Nostoc sp.]